MFSKEEFEKYLSVYESDGAFSVDETRRKYIIFGDHGLTVYRNNGGSSWQSKHVSDWRHKSCVQINEELRNQRWKDEG